MSLVACCGRQPILSIPGIDEAENGRSDCMFRAVPSLLHLATKTCITAEVSELGEAVSEAVQRQGVARQALDMARRAIEFEGSCHPGPSTRAMARARARRNERRPASQSERPPQAQHRPCSLTDLEAASAEAKRADKAVTLARESARIAWEAAGVKFIGWPSVEEADALEKFAASFGRVGLGVDQSMRRYCKPCHYQERNHVPQPGCRPPTGGPPRVLRNIPCPLCSWELGVGFTRTEDFICPKTLADNECKNKTGCLQHKRLGLVCLNPQCIARLMVFLPHKNVKLRMCCVDEVSYLQQTPWDTDPIARWVIRRPAQLHDSKAHQIQLMNICEEERIWGKDEGSDSDSEREDLCLRGSLTVQRAQRESHRHWRAALMQSDPPGLSAWRPQSICGQPQCPLSSEMSKTGEPAFKRARQVSSPETLSTPTPKMWIRRSDAEYCPTVFVVPADDNNAYACSHCRNKTWESTNYRYKNLARCCMCITCVRMLETEIPCRRSSSNDQTDLCARASLESYDGESEIGIDLCNHCGKPVCHLCESDEASSGDEDDNFHGHYMIGAD